MTTIKITPRQNEYLLELVDGPKTGSDLVLSLMVSAKGVGKMMRILREKGLVDTKLAPSTGRGGTRLHSLTKSYDELVSEGLTVVAVRNPRRSDAELRHAVKLRVDGLTGQRLVEAYQKLFPDRTANGVRHSIEVARERGMCR